MKINKKEIKRILIIRLAMIGDVVLTTPLVRNLRKNFPHAHLTYIVGKRAAPILYNNPYIDELIVSQKIIFSVLAKKEKYDLAIDLMGVDATAQLCVISGAKYRVGVYGRKSPYYNFVLKKASQGVNVMDYFMGMFKKLDLNCFGNKQTEIFLTPQEKQFADKKLMKCKNRIVGIQPACTAPKERWPETKFAQLADILIEKYKLNVVIFQGPGEEKVAKGMIRQMKQKAILLPFKGMRKYLALLSKCDLFVANEGGQIHMAMALKFPTIGISSLSNPNHKYWLYYKNNFKKIISNDIRAVSVIQVLKALSP